MVWYGMVWGEEGGPLGADYVYFKTAPLRLPPPSCINARPYGVYANTAFSLPVMLTRSLFWDFGPFKGLLVKIGPFLVLFSEILREKRDQ